MDIAQYLAELLVDHDEVTVPGFGVFYREGIPASFNSDTGMFEPPSFRLAFSEDPRADDLLVNYISQAKHISAGSAEFFAGRFGEEQKRKLEADGRVDLGAAGVIERTEEGLRFTSELLAEDLDNFGLKAVSEPGPDELIEPETSAEAAAPSQEDGQPVDEAARDEHNQYGDDPSEEPGGSVDDEPLTARPSAVESDSNTEAADAAEGSFTAPGSEAEPVIIPPEPTPAASSLPVLRSDYVQETAPSHDVADMFDHIVLREKSSSWLNEIPEDYGVQPRKRRIWIPVLLWTLAIVAVVAAVYVFWEPIVKGWRNAMGTADSTELRQPDTLARKPLAPAMPLVDSLADSTAIGGDTSMVSGSDSSKLAPVKGRIFIVRFFNRREAAEQFMKKVNDMSLGAQVLAEKPQIIVSVGLSYPDNKSAQKALIDLRNKISPELNVYIP